MSFTTRMNSDMNVGNDIAATVPSNKLKRIRDLTDTIDNKGLLVKKAKGLFELPKPSDSSESTSSPVLYGDSSSDSDGNDSHSLSDDWSSELVKTDGGFYITRCFENGKIPFGFELKRDGLFLDATTRDAHPLINQFAERNKVRNLFATHIQAYKNDTTVSKHCEPWGDKALLFNELFVIQKKFYGANRELSFVILKDKESPYMEYLVDASFFMGWTDAEAMKRCHSFS